MTSASGLERIEVVTSVQRRRRWSFDEKLRAVEESNVPGMTVSFVARRYGISPSLLFRWRKLMAEGGKVDVQLASGDSINVFGLRRREVLDRPFQIVADLVINAGVYEFHRAGITLKRAGYRRFAPALTLESGTFFDGRREDATISTVWAPSRHLILDASYAVNRLRLDAGDFTTRVITLRANAAFNVQWAWTTSLQYDNVSQRIGVNTRLRYIVMRDTDPEVDSHLAHDLGSFAPEF